LITSKGNQMKKVILTLCLLLSYVFAGNAKDIIASSCYACHGDNMDKSCYGVSKIPNKLNQDTIFKTLRAYKLGTKNIYGMGEVMKSQLKSLSDDDLKKLSVYIPTLR